MKKTKEFKEFLRNINESLTLAVEIPPKTRSIDLPRITISIIDKDWAGIYLAFTLSELPGCCGVGLLHNVSTYGNIPSGKLLLQKIIPWLLKEEFICWGSVIFTDIPQGNIMKGLVNKDGWKKVNTFKNPGSGNQVSYYIKTFNARR
jgi:hypothetical protein